jgi:hypothetical protein
MARTRINESVSADYLSPTQLARRWQISRSKAYAMQHVLPVLRIGDNVRFPRDAVIAYERARLLDEKAS